MAKTDGPVTIKKYANRRLYNTGTSTYVTLEDLATMVKNGEDFAVSDAKTGEDITRSVLTQIIFEQENKEGAQNLLPINFLRQLIRFYGDSMQKLVPSYLEVSLESFTREQEKFRQQITQAFGATPFGPLVEDTVRRNMDMFKQAFSMFTPFGPRGGEAAGCRRGREAGAQRRHRSRRAQAPARRHAQEGREAERRREIELRLGARCIACASDASPEAQGAAPHMTRESMRDQLVHEIGLRQSARFPKLRIHADRSEPRKRVHLVDEDVVAGKEEIDPCHAFAAEQAKRLDRKILKPARLLRGQVGRNAQVGSLGVEVLCLIRIEAVLAGRDDLAKL